MNNATHYGLFAAIFSDDQLKRVRMCVLFSPFDFMGNVTRERMRNRKFGLMQTFFFHQVTFVIRALFFLWGPVSKKKC